MRQIHKKQYTVRDLPPRLDRRLREKSRETGKSLNKVVLEVLTRGAGLADRPLLHHDLDGLIGTWKNDPKFDQAIEDQDQIDSRLWK